MLPLLPEAWVPQSLQPPVLAFAIALVAGGLIALAGGRRVAGAGAGIALVVALFLVFGVRMVTPRMLPERLPWLALAAFLGGLVGDLAGARRWPAALIGTATALGGAWFMLGAPRILPDLERILAEALPVTLAFAVPLWRLLPRREGGEGALAASVAAALLAAGLHVAAGAPLFVGLAMTVASAAIGAAPSAALRRAGLGLAGALPLAALIGGVAAAAGLAQRSPPVLAACCAPLLGLLAGPWLGRRLGLGAGAAGAVGTALAGLPAVAFAWAASRLG